MEVNTSRSYHNINSLKVGSGSRVLLGLDPFIGGGFRYRLLDGLLVQLHCRGLYTLDQLSKVGSSFPDSQEWPFVQDISLLVSYAGEWNSFLQVLNLSGITLSVDLDLLTWSWNKEVGVVRMKEAYNALTYSLFDETCKWWYSFIWKIKVPSKIILFMCLCLKNKVST
jgi:hypothetical protein